MAHEKNIKPHFSLMMMKLILCTIQACLRLIGEKTNLPLILYRVALVLTKLCSCAIQLVHNAV